MTPCKSDLSGSGFEGLKRVVKLLRLSMSFSFHFIVGKKMYLGEKLHLVTG